MLVQFSPFFVADTKIIFRYDYVFLYENPEYVNNKINN